MTTPPQPGWYDDPHDASGQRYWDGQGWTPHRQRKPTARPTPPPPRQPPPPRNPPRPPGPRPPAAAGPPQPVPSPTPPLPPQARPPGLATVKGFPAKPPIAGLLVFGGLVIAVVATFFPFATVSINVFGMTFRAHEVSASGEARVVVFLLVAAAVGLAWPALSGSAVAIGRLIGLSVVVLLLVVVAVVAYVDISEHDSKGEGIVKVSPAFGLLLYGAGVVVIAVAVVWLWIDRSQRQRQAR
jgi:hypothetical protein